MHFMHSKYEVFSSEVHTWKSDNIRKHLQSFLCLFSATYALPWRFFPPFSDFTDQRREQLHQRRSGGEGVRGGGGVRWCCLAVGKHLAALTACGVVGWRGRWTQCGQMCCRSPPLLTGVGESSTNPAPTTAYVRQQQLTL